MVAYKTVLGHGLGQSLSEKTKWVEQEMAEAEADQQ